jgi:hypothetical protein
VALPVAYIIEEAWRSRWRLEEKDEGEDRKRKKKRKELIRPAISSSTLGE